MDSSKKRIRLKCRFENEIRIVIISPDYTFAQLQKRLKMDYGFDISLKYEDQDGDLITLTSQNDFEDLLTAESDVVNVIVSENILPSLSKQQPKVESLWSQGAAPTPTANWAKEQQNHHRSNSPFNHTSSLMSVRHGSTNRLLDRFPHIDSVAPPLSERTTRWKRGEILGKGAFGVVYLGLNTDTGELMAVKQISNDELRTKELSSLENEISVLQTLKHPNIVRYIGTEANPNTLSIFLEYVPGGSLKSLIDKFGKLEESIVRSYTRQILLGLEYLHRNGIAHRDIKGANCLVGNDGAVKLADFGASNSWRSPVENKEAAAVAAQDSSSNDVKGTPSWMSPEVIRGEKPLNWKKADVWSLGCTTIEMTTGSPPWSQFNNPVTVLYHIACSEVVPDYPEDPSIELLTFLNSCLKRDPNERTDITSLLLHPFVASVQIQAPGTGAWNAGNWGQRPTTVSTTPVGEWEDMNHQWKTMTPANSSMRQKDSDYTLKTSPRFGDNTARDMESNSSTPALLENSSRKSSLPLVSDLTDIDMESTVSRNIIDANSIVRAYSSRNMSMGRKQSVKSQAMADNLSPLTVQDFKKDEDKQQISDLLSVASLENSIETFPDDLDDSASTLGSGRVILESLDGIVSLNSHDNVKVFNSNLNFNDVKVSPINDGDEDSNSFCLNTNRKMISNSQQFSDIKHCSKEDEKVPKVIERKNSGISTTSSKSSKKVVKQSNSLPNKHKTNAISSSNKDKSVNSPSNLVSPVKQPAGSSHFTKNLEIKLANNNEKVIEKVIKPLTKLVSPGIESSPATTIRKKPLPIQANQRVQPPNSSTTVPASPIRVSTLHNRSTTKPYEFSNRPGEKKVSGSKPKRDVNVNSRDSSNKQHLEEENSDDKKLLKVMSSSHRSLTDEIKDEAEVHEEIEFKGCKEDDASVADELSDDSGLRLGDTDDSDHSSSQNKHRHSNDDVMEFGRCLGTSMSGFDWLSSNDNSDKTKLQFYDQDSSNTQHRGNDNWTADSYSKNRKYKDTVQSDSHSPNKHGLTQSQSTSSVISSENSSNPNIGMYALVGHSFKQGSAHTGSVHGTRIKTSFPSSKQMHRNTKSSVGNSSSSSKQSNGHERGSSAFRNLKVAGDSIDLRIGTGSSSRGGALGTPLTSQKNRDKFLDDGSMEGFSIGATMEGPDDDHSEDSIAVPLQSEGEELDEHTLAITKLRMATNKNVFVSASLDSSIRLWGTQGSKSSLAVLDIPSFDAKAKKAMPTTPKPIKFCGLWVDVNCDFIWGGCSDGIIRVWSGGEGKPYRMVKGHEDLVTNIEGAPLEYMSSHNCASASLDKTARVWDTRAKKAQCALFRGHTDTIYSLKWLDGGRSIATASKDKTIKIWDVRTGRLQTTIDKHYGTVNLLKTLPEDFKAPNRKDSAPDGNVMHRPPGPVSHFLSAARDGTMSLWSSDGTCLASQGAHRTAVTCMSDVQSRHVLKDTMPVTGPCVVTSGVDNFVRVWDTRRMKVTSEFNLPNVVKVAWFNNSIITGSAKGDMYIWDYYNDGDSENPSRGGWTGRELSHHSHQCSDIVTSKHCVATASKSGNILRFTAL